MNICISSFSPRAALAISVICTSVASTTVFAENDESAQAANQPFDSFSQVIVPMAFRNGETHLRVLDNINGVAIAEGDIIFGDAEQYFYHTKQRSVRGLSNYVYGTVWPNGVVPYRISDQLSASAVAKVNAAIERWNDTGAITLIERTDATAAAYPNYIDFIDANQCASWVGFQNTGAQSIYTGDKCSEGSMIHEIGHALGLLHEHTRPDRDNYVQINWDSITTDKTHNFDILTDAITLGEYDYSSIMHYGTHFFSADGRETITALQNTDAKIGQREFISEGDEQSVIELYQSDLSIVSAAPGSAVAAADMQLDMFITNNSDMGANRVSLRTSVPEESKLVSFSSSSWICQQAGTGEDVVCQTSVLAKNANSSVSMNLTTPASTGQASFTATLDSSTFDTDQSNNTDRSNTTLVATSNDVPTNEKAAAQPQPAFAAATDQAATSGGSSGGGAFGPLGLLLLICRRKLV